MTHFASIAALLAIAMSAHALQVAEGEAIDVSGSGCKPFAEVSITAGAPHASGRRVARGTADEHGRFTVKVNVPFMGEETATIYADCEDPNGDTHDAARIPITYSDEPPPGTPRVTTSTSIPR